MNLDALRKQIDELQSLLVGETKAFTYEDRVRHKILDVFIAIHGVLVELTEEGA